MTVTSPYLRGTVNDPHVADGLADDPHTNYICGLVDDPGVAGGLVDDPRTNHLCGLVDDPRVAGGLAKITFAGWSMILALLAGRSMILA
jgi:hypothetical protein